MSDIIRPVIASGNSHIDGLLSGIAWASNVITYSFPKDFKTGFPDFTRSDFFNLSTDYVGFSLSEQAVLTKAIASFSAVCGATFVDLTATSPGTAQMRLGTCKNRAVGVGAAELPGDASGGDAILGRDGSKGLSLIPGSSSYNTFLHEFMHGLGFKHPFDAIGPEYGFGFGQGPSIGNSSEWTVLAYDTPAQSLMRDDIRTLQYIYGVNFKTHSGDTLYQFGADGSFIITENGQKTVETGANFIYRTIWDGGGNDTYDFSNFSNGMRIDLNPGASSLISRELLQTRGNGKPVSANLFNAFLYRGNKKSLIENAIGGVGDDFITGNIGQNRLEGGGGNDTLVGLAGDDTLIGGGGNDTAVFKWRRWNYSASSSADGVVIRGNGAALADDGQDLCQSIEFYSFFDGTYTANDLLFGSKINIDGSQTSVNGTAYADLFVVKATIPQAGVSLNGGNGFDWADFSAIAIGGSINLAKGIASFNGGQTGSYQLSLTSIEAVRGTMFNDTITGDSGDNIFFGGEGNDIIDGGNGIDVALYMESSWNFSISCQGTQIKVQNNKTMSFDILTNIETIRFFDREFSVIFGSAKNDYFNGSAANEIFIAQNGNDVVNGGGGNDWIFGGAGADILDGGEGDDVVMAGAGDDLIYVNSGHDSIFGNDGDDIVYCSGQGFGSTIDGGQGEDTFVSGSVSYYYSLLAGDDGQSFLFFYGNEATVVRNVEKLIMSGVMYDVDFVSGTASRNKDYDFIVGSIGSDAITLTGNDVIISGGKGDDTIVASGSALQIDGDAGDDTIIVNYSGEDTYSHTLVGGDGDDTIIASNTGDYIYGGVGSNVMTGGHGGDVFYIEGTGLYMDPETYLYRNDDETIINFNADTASTYADTLDLTALEGAVGAKLQWVDKLQKGVFGMTFANGILSLDLNADGRSDKSIHLLGVNTLDHSLVNLRSSLFY